MKIFKCLRIVCTRWCDQHLTVRPPCPGRGAAPAAPGPCNASPPLPATSWASVCRLGSSPERASSSPEPSCPCGLLWLLLRSLRFTSSNLPLAALALWSSGMCVGPRPAADVCAPAHGSHHTPQLSVFLVFGSQ